MRNNTEWAIDVLRTIQQYFEREYDDFRTDRIPGETLESLICELEEWGE